MTEKAYAKINLYLDVTGKRRDGFHEIRSIMQTVSLCDELDMDITEAATSSVELSVSLGEGLSSGACDIGAPKDNLVTRAALLYLDRANIKAKVRVKLTKNIPVAAGLAGGSADAAATLRALNKHYSVFTVKELCELSAELGSDIPFCVEGGTALCAGRGEQTVRLSYTPDLNIVIAIGKSRISTPVAYRALDEAYSDFDGTEPSHGSNILSRCREPKTASAELRAHLLPADKAESCVYNIFESSGLPELAEVENIKSSLRSLGAVATLMSGSGPSVFGIFYTKSEAERAAAELSANRIYAVYANAVRY